MSATSSVLFPLPNGPWIRHTGGLLLPPVLPLLLLLTPMLLPSAWHAAALLVVKAESLGRTAPRPFACCCRCCTSCIN
jgi:hypothetical protein